MPRKAVDDVTVTQLNKYVREIEEGTRKPGLIRVGGVGGLALNARMREYPRDDEPDRVALSASWVLRRTHGGQRRDFALGAWPEVTLAKARERARDVMDQLWQGIDPTEERRAAARANAPAAPTFRKAAQDYFNRGVRGRISKANEGVWFNDLESFAFAFIGNMPVDKIERHHIVAIIDQPHIKYGTKDERRLSESVPDRAASMLKKVERILEELREDGTLRGDNPARRTGRIKTAFPVRTTVDNHPALPYAQLPAFVAALRAREPSPSSRALEFLILTAVRSKNAREATWDEIDMESGLWTIPAAKMKVKGGREHRVPLSAAAMAVLKATPPVAGTPLIWPGQGLRKPMTDMTLAAMVKKMHAKEVAAGRAGWLDPRRERPAVPHGFRSTFRDWVAETTNYPGDMAEIALAHDVGNKVEQAYRRGDQLEKRRQMMDDWGNHALAAVGSRLRAVGT